MLIPKLQLFFSQRNLQSNILLDLIDEFNASPEIFTHRLTNVLPRFFGIQELFFLRFTNENDSNNFDLTKEMHLSGLHDPHMNMQLLPKMDLHQYPERSFKAAPGYFIHPRAVQSATLEIYRHR
jgi:hypothetical protein